MEPELFFQDPLKDLYPQTEGGWFLFKLLPYYRFPYRSAYICNEMIGESTLHFSKKGALLYIQSQIQSRLDETKEQDSYGRLEHVRGAIIRMTYDWSPILEEIAKCQPTDIYQIPDV